MDAPSYIRMNKLYAQSSWYVADDGSDIYTVFFKAHPPSRGVIVYHHGLSCHSHWGEDVQAKRSLFEPLQQARFHVYTYDARGHGRTGVANHNLGSARLDDLTEDFYTAVHDMVSAYPALPIYVMGHSLGGGVVTRFIADKSSSEVVKRIHGYILLAPMSDPGVAFRGAAKILSAIAPKLRVPKSIIGHSSMMSKDVAEAGLTGEQVEALLAKYNVDGDGFLSKAELTAVLNGDELNLKLSPEDIDAAFDQMNTNGDGKVSIAEFSQRALCPRDELEQGFHRGLNVELVESLLASLGPFACNPELASHIKSPLLLIHGVNDQVNPFQNAKRYVLESTHEVTVPPMPETLRHGLFSDSDAPTVWREVLRWLGGHDRGYVGQ